MLELHCDASPADLLRVESEEGDDHLGVATAHCDSGSGDPLAITDAVLGVGKVDALAAYLRTWVDQKRGTFTLTFTREELDRLSAAFDAEDKELFARIERVRAARGIDLWAESDEPEDES